MKSKKMKSLLGGLLVIYGLLSSASAAWVGFVATFPAVVYENINATLCFRLASLDAVTKDISFMIDDAGSKAFPPTAMKLSRSARREHCFSLKVSDLSNGFENEMVKEIRIKAQLPQGSFEDKRSFVFKRISTHNTFISTDKPIYRPGELVKFRILTLDHSLKPRPVVLKDIQLRDAAGSVVDCWRNFTSKYGLMQFESRLTRDPLFGKWTIKVVDDLPRPDLATNFAEFEVKKYILPKFEVSIQHQPHADYDNKNFEIKASALYSFGLPVKGTYSLNVTAIPGMHDSYEKIPIFVRDEFKKRTGSALKFTKFTSTKQCHDECVFRVNLNDLTNVPATDPVLDRNGFSYNVSVSVVELGTDSSGTSSSLIEPKSSSEERFDVQLLQPSHYKPGLPVRLVLKPTIKGSAPKTPGLFKIKLVRAGTQTFTTEMEPDREGLIVFEYLNNDESNRETLFIEVLKDDRVLAILPVKPWVNGRDLQMKLYQNSPFRCGQKALVELKLSGDSKPGRQVYLQIQSKFSTYDLGVAKLNSNGAMAIESLNNETQELFQLGAPSDQPAGGANLVSRSDCDLPVDVGNGNDDTQQKIKYYYRADRKSCEPFIYRGNGGNANRFVSRTDCQRKCIYKAQPEKLTAPSQSTKPWITTSAKDNFYQFSLTIPSQLSPKFSIFAFVLDQEQGVVMDYLNGTMDEKCLPNKVNLTLDKESVEVRDRVMLTIKSDPNALCAISAVDKRITFLKEKQNKLNVQDVFERLRAFDSENPSELESEISSHSREDEEDDRYFRPSELLKKNKLILIGNMDLYPREIPDEDATPSFELVDRRRPLSPEIRRPQNFEMNAEEPSKSVRRQYFPETWIWNLHFLDSKGSKFHEVYAPDSITDWYIDGYCLSSKNGLGVSETKTLRVYQNLFVVTDLPSLSVSGEKFPINVKIFNQMKFCTPVVVYLDFPESAFRGDKTARFDACSCPGDILDVEFKLESKSPDSDKLKNISAILSAQKNDSVCSEQKRMRKATKLIDFYDTEETGVAVKNEGVLQELTKNDLTFSSQERGQERVFTFEVPDNIAKDSLKVAVKINGDLVWPLLDNLDQIMRQPVGNPDHILARMTPLIHILNYLIKTNQSTPELTDKITDHLKQDYQRMLAYNTGLNKVDTKFVATRLHNLAELVHLNVMQIDEDRLQTDFDLLLINLRRLMEDQDEQDDLGDGQPDKEQQKLALVAYTTMAIMKSHIYIPDIGDDYSAASEYEFLHKRVEELDLKDVNTVTLAMLYLAFQYEQKKPGDSQQITHKQSIKAEIDSRIKKNNGFAYWLSEGCSSANSFECKTEKENPSADLEVTSFVLLGKLVDVTDFKKIPPQELDTIKAMVKWINSQRNAQGGFEGSLANAAALEALAQYSLLAYKKDVNFQYQITYTQKSGTNSKQGSINESNRLAGDTVPLVGNFAKKNTVRVKITGNGLANIQLNVNYNLVGPKAYSNGTGIYELEPTIETVACDEDKCPTNLRISARYIGEGDQADDMVIISMRLPSKFKTSEEGAEEAVKEQPNFQRLHLVPDENLVYFVFDTMTKDGVEFELPLEEKYEIENMKPGLISVYSYNSPPTATIKPLEEVKEENN